MKLKFENIGPIDEAEMELGDLTILAGQNNTGKSYLAYSAWYAQRAILGELDFSKNIDTLPNDSPVNVKTIIEAMALPKTAYGKVVGLFKDVELFGSGRVGIDVDIKALKKVIKDGAENYQNRLDSENNKLNRDQAMKIAWNQYIEKNGFYDDLTYNLLAAMLYREWLSKRETQQRELIMSFCAQSFKKALFPDKHYILSTERSSFFMFKNDVDRSKSIKQYDYDSKIEPVDYGFRMAGNIVDFSDKPGEWYKENPHLEKLFQELFDGRLEHDARSPIFFPKDSSLKLRFRHLSASIRSLAMFYYILKHFIKRGDLIVIDEPESYLNPKKQIQLARIMAFCVNKGVKILLTTHSDFIIREFDNLILLDQLNPKPAIYSEYAPMSLNHKNKIRAYITKWTGENRIQVNPAPIGVMGIDIVPIDEVIDEQNEHYNSLADMVLKI